MFNISKVKKNSGGINFIAIDLGTESVKIGVFLKETEGKIQLIGHSIVDFKNINPSELFEKDKEVLLNKLKVGVDQAKSFSTYDPKKVIIGIPSANISSQTVTVRIKRTTPDKKITQKEVEQITQKIIANSKIEADKYFSQKHENFDSEIDLLNSDITFVKIDGYITKELEGFRGTTLEISFFTTFATTKYLNKLVNLAKDLKLDLSTITTNIYALNKALKSREDSNYILLDLGGKNTDIAISFGGEIQKITNFKLGGQSFTNYISNLSNIDAVEARKYLLSETEKNEKLETYNQEIKSVWFDNLKSALESVEGVKVYPEEILLLGGGSEMVDIDKMFNAIRNLKFKDEPKIRILVKDNFDFYEDHTEQANDVRMLNVLTLGKFALKILENE
ncbi:hypothetical protein COV24_01270 [candidate division WWE3 bacterium CG10_big_fil_rev_8_21_14_0_10_32_10]|uniref:SHS2 domain-containing protein n=1 Tax=candidate division WWE3 bacterium CG10_big_fil_rev_8_21_14_0_10_32_10 TaxID=1975090 RepID=A0A2H0RAW6_UNCKA|nr:MAG: hypothetical protein COV24_01270 [candidate division WWE3 bacterium CG10_big_fil_rev_8_21_14_0_10_32_10]